MIQVTLIFRMEYDEGEIAGDPAENLLEVLAMQSDADLMELITVETMEEG